MRRNSASLGVIPINGLKFALRSPVIGVSILQPSGRRQILIPLEPFVPADFIASVLARYSKRVVHIIFQNASTDQHSVTIARSTRELTGSDKTSFTGQHRIMIRESAQRFKTPTPTAPRSFASPERIPEEITSYKLRGTCKLQRFNTARMPKLSRLARIPAFTGIVPCIAIYSAPWRNLVTITLMEPPRQTPRMITAVGETRLFAFEDRSGKLLCRVFCFKLKSWNSLADRTNQSIARSRFYIPLPVLSSSVS